jgi:lipopolysaccharide biosynthesis glycosyltransferase
MSVDTRFVRQLAVAVCSIARTTDGPCRVHVLHDGLERADREQVEASGSATLGFEWIDVRDAVASAELPVARPASMYTRLFIGEMLDPAIERVIYLDADVVVRRSLGELWSADLGAASLGAVRDAYMPWIVQVETIPWRDLGIPPDTAHFNSGMMVVSMRDWRRREVGSRALGLLSASSGMLDQCALNAVLVDDWQALHPRWNVQSYHLTGAGCLAYASEGAERLDAALADPAIVHFTLGTFNRPWQAPCSNPYRDLWLEHLDRTPWRGWRPRPAPLLSRMRRRAGRAAQVALRGGSG